MLANGLDSHSDLLMLVLFLSGAVIPIYVSADAFQTVIKKDRTASGAVRSFETLIHRLR